MQWQNLQTSFWNSGPVCKSAVIIDLRSLIDVKKFGVRLESNVVVKRIHEALAVNIDMDVSDVKICSFANLKSLKTTLVHPCIFLMNIETLFFD